MYITLIFLNGPLTFVLNIWSLYDVVRQNMSPNTYKVLPHVLLQQWTQMFYFLFISIGQNIFGTHSLDNKKSCLHVQHHSNSLWTSLNLSTYRTCISIEHEVFIFKQCSLDARNYLSFYSRFRQVLNIRGFDSSATI